jgi:hypothetical protein
MVTKERHPPLGRLWISRSLAHPTQHGSFRNVEAQHLQLAVNARRTPSRVVSDHAEDEVAKFPADTFSSSARSMPRKPRPIQLEASTVPTNDRLRLDEDQHLSPSRPEPSQDYPKQLVRSGKSRFGCLRSKTPSCCRSTRFSNRRSRCEQMHRLKKTTKRLSWRTMRPVLHGNGRIPTPRLYT